MEVMLRLAARSFCPTNLAAGFLLTMFAVASSSKAQIRGYVADQGWTNHQCRHSGPLGL